MPIPPSDRLAEYRRKRQADKTPEPFDEGAAAGAGIFVVQKHAATRLHYDLRLEHDGVLMSWAVPGGISFDPSVKRFAAHTEDHPIEYADFEGVIPQGEYGGGEMVVWDRGALTWDEDPSEGITKGKLLFSLHGYKLVGQWTLVQMKKNPKEWLLIKHTDAWSHPDDERDVSEASVLTGRTVEDLREAADVDGALAGWAADHGAAPGGIDPSGLDLMLAKNTDAPFTHSDWLFEVKYDGYRLVASKDGRSVQLRYRSGLDATSLFPDLTSALRRLPFERFVIDGEVVVLDADGRPSFSALQRRGKLSSKHTIAAAAARSPATFFGFDLISVGDMDLRGLPLLDRKDALRQLLPVLGPLRYTDHFVGIGQALFDQAVALGLEGVMAKRANSQYVGGRSDHWLKVKAEQMGTFAIVGFTKPQGSRASMGALHIAAINDHGLVYAGRVGSGISDRALDAIHSELTTTVVPTSAVSGVPPPAATDTWVDPTLACTIRFKELTTTGSLRHPVFVDLVPLDPGDLFEVESAEREEPPPPAVVDTRTTEPSNPDKVFWPDDGYTKGDLIAYYTAVADHLLPYLIDRPLVLDRYPDGIDGKSFFQKNAPEYVPDWIRTQWVGNDDGKGNTYFIVNDADALRYIANLASIPLHLWASRLASIEQPDWCILDLDPKGAPFTAVVTVAREIRRICGEMDVPCYVKTSGKTGLHVLIPMGHGFSYNQQKLLGELVARVTESRLDDIATTVRNPAGREGKVYLDYLQNGKGKLLVGPYSVRPVAGATVSAPLRWDEVTPSLDVGRFTIRSMPRRLGAMKDDPLAPVLTDVPDVAGGLSKLASMYSG